MQSDEGGWPTLAFVTIVTVMLACLFMAGRAERADRTNPQVAPSAAREGVSYCPTRAFGQPQSYYPCMYSSREFSA